MADGQPTDLSIEKAVSIGLSKSLDIESANREIESNEAKKREADSLKLPKADILASQTHLGSPLIMETPAITFMGMSIAIPGENLAKQDESRLTAVAMLPIYTSGAAENAQSAARFGVEASRQSLSGRAGDVAYTITQNYLKAVLAAQVEQVNAEALDDVQAHLNDAEKLYNQGIVAEYDVLRAKKEFASQNKRLTDATNQATLAQLALLNSMNEPLSSSYTLSTPLSKAAYDGSESEAAAKAGGASNWVKALELKSKAEESLGKAQAAQAKPSITALAMHNLYQRDLTSIEPNSLVMLTLNWPLYDGGAGAAKEAEQKHASEESKIAAQKLKDTLELGVHQAVKDLDSGGKSLDEADKTLDLANEGKRLATKRFDVGVGTSVEKIDAILGVSEAKTQRAYALYQIDSAYYRLQYLTNTLLAQFKASNYLVGKDTVK
jgi:outer membrane protein TolC